MERTIENLDSLKEHWLENNFIGGAILCSFILVKQKGLDLVFDGNHSLVKEYKELLKKRLESDNIQLLLMVNTEIERCYYREESEEIYRLLPDEIYDHYDKGGKNYPIQAVVLHIEIIRALHNMDEIDESADYLWTLKETYESCFGSESYRFCINWCHILKEVLIEYAPEVEIAEFEKNVDLFMSQLGEEVIFYDLCLKTAVRNQQINQELPLFEQAIELCNSSLKNCKTEVRKELWSYVDGFIAKGWRQLGKIDNAIKYLKKAKEGTQDSKYQMFLLSHIASLYYEKKDFDAMYHYIQEGLMLVNTLDVLDENVAELYNAYGMYNLDLGRYEKAMHEIERAVDISKKVTGEESDQVMKFKSNIALVNFRNGYYDKACEQLDELLDIALTSGKQYKISLPLIINNMIGMGDNFKLSSLTVNKIKKAFNLAYDMHDDVTASYVKSNFYYLMVTSGNSYEYINELEQELEEYYNANPNAQGYIEFLKAMAHRYACNNKLSNASLLLEKVCDYYQKVPLKAWSIEYLNYFYIKLRLNLYKKNFRESREMFSSLYENVMFPLFEQLEEKKQETFIERIRSYVSIYISAYQQYPEMQLLVSELYDFVLNTKYLIDLYSRDSNKLKKIIRGKNQLSYKDIKMDKESLVIESIIYAKHDLLKNDNFIGTKILTNSVEEYTYLMSFVINCTNTFVKTKHVDILSNKSWNEIIDELFQDSGEDCFLQAFFA